MKRKRAYASGAVLPNGEFWITGGADSKQILNTVEILSVKNDRWKVRSGTKLPRPLIGHCFAHLNSNEVIIAGGYSPEEDSYSKKVDILNMKTNKWTTKTWMLLNNGGPRFDASCLNILVGSKSRIVMAGGWNNTGMVVTEYFDELSQSWNMMGKNVGELQNNSIKESKIIHYYKYLHN